MQNLLFQFDVRQLEIAGWQSAYSKEGDGDDDAPVLAARKLVDGVADVAVALGRATGANTCGSFGRHFVLCYCVGNVVFGDAGLSGDDVSRRSMDAFMFARWESCGLGRDCSRSRDTSISMVT